MKEQIRIRPVRSDEYQLVSNLVLNVFDLDVAPLYVDEGIDTFHAYAQAKAMKERSHSNHLMLVAETEDRIVGAAEVRDFNHLSLLFVDRKLQRSGIGRSLVLEILRMSRAQNPSLKGMTVNSSPNAVEAYQRLGFKPSGEMQRTHGIDFTPMVIEI